jgi:hypothetical protein
MEDKYAKRIGDLQEVTNKGRKFGSALKYFYVRLQSPNGEEKEYLFTENEVLKAEQRARINPEDLLKISKIRDFVD